MILSPFIANDNQKCYYSMRIINLEFWIIIISTGINGVDRACLRFGQSVTTIHCYEVRKYRNTLIATLSTLTSSQKQGTA